LKLAIVAALALAAASASAQKTGLDATLYNSTTPCAGACYGVYGRNEHVGTGEDLNNGLGNYGVTGVTAPTGGATGIGAGLFGLAAFNDVNIGVLSRASIYKAGATNIGLAAFTLNDSAGVPSGITTGAYISLSALPSTKAALNAQLVPAGLIVDTKATGSPAIIARHNGAEMFSVPAFGQLKISDGGNAKPTCDAAHRFWMWSSDGGAAADMIEACLRNVFGVYAWAPVAQALP
jgi:hypothetical protein